MLGKIENETRILGIGTMGVGTFLAIHSLLTAAWMEAAGGTLISSLGVVLMMSEQPPSRKRSANLLPPPDAEEPEEIFESARPSLDGLKDWERLHAFQNSGARQELAKMFRAANRYTIAQELEEEEKLEWSGQLDQFEELRSKKRFQTILKKAQNGQPELWEGLKVWVHWDPEIGKTVTEIEELENES